MPYKFFSVFVLLFFFSVQEIHSQFDCDFNLEDRIEGLRELSNVDYLEIRINNDRKWVKNGLKIIKNNNENIGWSFKKSFKGTVKVKYKFGSCVHQAKIRQTGDWKNHIAFVGGRLVQSLDITLKENNIAGIVKFKVLIPKTRNSQNEIIGSILLRKLNFLSPRTRLMPVSVNGQTSTMIFQEKIVKEFLESQYRREGPLLEGDERFLWDKNYGDLFSKENISLSKQLNAEWSNLGSNPLYISIDAISRLQNVYMGYSNQFPLKKLTLELYKLANNSEHLLELWKEFEILMTIMNASHGLRPHNRKFYWNPFYQGFEPVYYDGSFSINNFKISKDLQPLDLIWYQANLSDSNFEGVIEKLKSINIDSFEKDLQLARVGATSIKPRQIISTIINNVESFRKMLKEKRNIAVKNNLDTNSRDTRNNYYERLSRAENDFYYVETALDSSENEVSLSHRICSEITCKAFQFSQNEMETLLEGKYIYRGRPVIYLGLTNTLEKKSFKTFIDELDLNIIHSEDMRISYEKNSRKITFTQENDEDWALISNHNLKEVKIEFVGVKKVKSLEFETQRINDFGLTGCITFYSIEFYKTSIKSEKGGCEDSINIINSFGTLDSLEVTEAYADSIDIDFSVLEIDNIFVQKAGNDCLDFSSGKYNLGEVQVEFCTDKAISIGERSFFNGTVILISNSNIGISSKDSSIAKIREINAENVDICLEAYNKKQEFNGSYLSVKNLNCEGLMHRKDDYSQVIINSRIF